LSTLQEQKKRHLTFEEICPYHSMTLAKWDKLTLVQRKSEARTICGNSSACFVGEAHGGTNKYIEDGSDPCPNCINYCSVIDGLASFFAPADNFYHFHYGTEDIDWIGFEKMKSEFVEHWNEVHLNK